MKTVVLYSYNEHSNHGMTHKEKSVLYFLSKIADIPIHFIVDGELNNAQIKGALDNSTYEADAFKKHINVDFRTYRGKKYQYDLTLNANAEKQGDPLYKNQYFSGNVNIYEIVFVKANRGIDDALIDRYTDWHIPSAN